MSCSYNPPPWGKDNPSSNPGQLVESSFESARSFANNAVAIALGTLSAMGDIEIKLPDIDVDGASLGNITGTISAGDLGDTNITWGLGGGPVFSGTGSVSNYDLSPSPTYTGGTPTVTDITAPVKFNGVKPTSPTNTDIAYPTVSERDLPDVPTLRSLTLPTAPTLIPVTFDGILPGVLEDAPDTSFSFTEPGYQSDLLDQLKTKLLYLTSDMVVGWGDAVREQNWNQSRDRTNEEAQRGITNATRAWSASGWDQPAGDLVEAISAAEQRAININVTDSRTEAIEEARLKQANFQFAITNAINLETQLLTYHNQVAQRAFEAAKFVIEAAVQVYGMLVSQYNARVQAYLAQAEVFKARIQAQLAEIEKFKAQIDAQRLINELNAQDVAIYKEQVQALDVIYGLYVKELEGTKVKLEERRVEIEKFGEQVKLYDSESKAHALEYDKYKTEVEAEKIKAEIFGIKGDLHKTIVDAWARYEEIRVKKFDSDIRLNKEIPVERYKAEAQAFAALAGAEGSRVGAEAEAIRARAIALQADLNAQAESIRAQGEALRANATAYSAKAGAQTEAGKAAAAAALAQAELISGNMRAAGTIASQLAAAALSIINVSAQASERQGFDLSYKEGVNVSFNCD